MCTKRLERRGQGLALLAHHNTPQLRKLQIKGRRQIWKQQEAKNETDRREIKIIWEKYHLSPLIFLYEKKENIDLFGSVMGL